MATKVIISDLYKFNRTWKKKKARRVVALMNTVINSEEFKEKVLAYDFQDTRYRRSSKEAYERLSDNQQIYDILMKGNEQESPEGDDHTWQLRIKLGRFLFQVGRREGDLIITQNWFFRKDGNEAAVAGHWAHEYAHMLGFNHDYEPTERRDQSVPYAIGHIIEEILEKGK
ncbi:hypothetical protein AB9P05_22195 [Roseivirga sp. BDSF3-8]|uniref:hypothetical protein n=1 Tax=Roseivirga sp. BDSF3-8 TaxID=3241598 RepID=UPI003531D158